MFHWKAQGDANFYVILEGNNWFCQIQFNGEMTTQRQEDYMDTLVNKLNKE